MAQNSEAVLVTGAKGFVGGHLCDALRNNGYNVFELSRDSHGDLSAIENWPQLLEGVDFVVHLAARVHRPKELKKGSLELFRRDNVELTKNIAEAAAKSGVKKFIFLSSIKVNGEGRESAYSEVDNCFPEDNYGVSKLEAELALNEISDKQELSTVIIRPPLIYGRGVKANFKSLIKISLSGMPLPFKSTKARRSLLYVGNLIDFISNSLKVETRGHELFLLSDGDDLSIGELVSKIATAGKRPVRLFPFPAFAFKAALATIGKGEVYDKLFGSLLIDSSKAKERWNPSFSVGEGIKDTVEHYEESL